MSYCPSFKFGLNWLFFPCCHTYCCIRLKTLFSWQCSYKAWGSLLGQQLSERNVIVACIDYRCFIFLQMLTYRTNSLCHMKFDYIIRISICIFIMSVGYPRIMISFYFFSVCSIDLIISYITNYTLRISTSSNKCLRSLKISAMMILATFSELWSMVMFYLMPMPCHLFCHDLDYCSPWGAYITTKALHVFLIVSPAFIDILFDSRFWKISGLKYPKGSFV